MILSMLPSDFPAPILVVVAMPDKNVSTVASSFAKKSRLPVATAQKGQMREAGNVYVAGTERLLLIEQRRLQFAQCESGVDRPRWTSFSVQWRGKMGLERSPWF